MGGGGSEVCGWVPSLIARGPQILDVFRIPTQSIAVDPDLMNSGAQLEDKGEVKGDTQVEVKGKESASNFREEVCLGAAGLRGWRA